MQGSWENGWALFALALVIVIVLAACAPVLTKEKTEQKEFLVTVEGTVTKVLDDDTDARGGKHQRLFMRVTKVLDNPENADIDLKQDVLVVMRYGDRDGFPQRINAFDRAEGKRIEVRGNYIPKDKNAGNDKRAIIHFTHKPVGYVRFENKTHR